jgi:hypothetical protein
MPRVALASGKSKIGAHSTALGLAAGGFVFVCYPIIGALLSIAATAVAIRTVRRNRDDYLATLVLGTATFVLSLDVAAIAWSILIGFYGIAVAPAPP